MAKEFWQKDKMKAVVLEETFSQFHE